MIRNSMNRLGVHSRHHRSPRLPLTPSVLMVLAGVAAARGCTSPPQRVALPAPEPARQQAALLAAVERETRYYVDEKGVVWDDRGKRREPTL